MEFLRKWLTFSKGERVAIVTILAAILILVLACLFRPTRQSLSDASLQNLDSLLALRQAAIEAQQQKQAEQPQEATELHPFPFNPNTVTEDELRQIGLTDRQIRNCAIGFPDTHPHILSACGRCYFCRSDLCPRLQSI